VAWRKTGNGRKKGEKGGEHQKSGLQAPHNEFIISEIERRFRGFDN
jgi:hypothetical protein